MKKIKKSNAFIFFLLIMGLSAQSQSIFLRFNNGSYVQYPLTDVQKVVFSGNNMQINLNTGAIIYWVVDSIKYFDYTSIVTDVAEINTNAIQLKVAPNPSNEVVNIIYTNSVSEKIFIEIFDVQGRFVDYLDLGVQQIGEHSFKWVARENGLYILKLHNKNQTICKKIIVL